MYTSIFYQPDEYYSGGDKIMGRNVASESFLKAYLSYSGDEHIFLTVDNLDYLTTFKRRYAKELDGRDVHSISSTNYDDHSKVGNIFFPSPLIEPIASKRYLFSPKSWSITGVTHTTSSQRITDGIKHLITAPVYNWDSVICTSTAVKRHLTNILDTQKQFLEQRFGKIEFTMANMPVIPLGIFTDDFEISSMQRSAAKGSLGVTEEDIVVLYVGRLSFHAKSNPLAMYQALEQASVVCSRKIVLIEVGWYANEAIEQAYVAARHRVLNHVRSIFLDGTKIEQRRLGWSAADIFCSFSDNIQETFGITPVEGMAAGLPVIASDWNGYKDTIRHGEEGFLVETTMPRAGTGRELSIRYQLDADSYDRYCGYTSSLVEVNIELAAHYLSELVENQPLRQKMGDAAKNRAVNAYSWSQIIPLYKEMWASNAEKRASFDNSSHNTPSNHYSDPFIDFSHYPTAQISQNMKVKLNSDNRDMALAKYRSLMTLAMVNYSSITHPEEHEVEKICLMLDESPRTIQEILYEIPHMRREHVERGISALLKLGIIFRVP